MTDKGKISRHDCISTMPVVLVDDELSCLDNFRLVLLGAGIENVETISDSREVMPALSRHGAAAVVIDLCMPYISGERLLSEIKRDLPSIPVIVMTANNDIEVAVTCMKNGAFDYLVKPVEKSRFASSVRKALEMTELRNEVQALKKHLLTGKLRNRGAFSSIVSGDGKMMGIFHYMEAISGSPQPVFITGETGVGKELIARTLHTLCSYKGPFVAVNVAGLDDVMFSDALFGHEKGAYTGAERQRGGMILQASGGTLFLDEMGDLNETSQVKLLRLLQDGVYYPLGSDIARKSDIRIIAATNRDLHSLLSAGKFRKDLYYRLNIHHIHVPPLRERPDDIPLLLDRLLEDAAGSMGKKRPTPPNELLTLLLNYPFPGNIRELQGMVFDAVARHESGVLSMDAFKELMKKNMPSFRHTESAPSERCPAGLSFSFSRFPGLKEVEEYFIEEALRRSNGNQSIAASLLGITRQAVSKRLRNRKNLLPENVS
jgi:two-component system response regulator HydG